MCKGIVVYYNNKEYHTTMKQKLLILFAALMLSTSMWALTMEDGYYLIGTAQDLKDFAALVNAGNTTANGKLTANIDLQGNSTNQWTPIGAGVWYNGTFDGQGFTVSNLYYHQVAASPGLFGHAGGSARIKNIRAVVDIDNTGNGATACCGSTEAGGILGTGVEGTLIINCSVAGSVISFSNVGGIVGSGAVTVVNSYNEATVKFYNNNGQVGCGIHGYGGTPTLINCYNVGKVINTAPNATSHMGNIAIFATVTNCYSLENSCQNGAGAAWSNQAPNGIPGTTMTAAEMQAAAFMNTLYSNALALRGTYPDIDTWVQDPTTGRPVSKQSYKPTEGPWTRAGEKTGWCSMNINSDIAWNGLINTQWAGTVLPYVNAENGLGSVMQGTARLQSKQTVYTLYETTQTVPSYSVMVWNWSFQMKGHYEGFAQQTGLYAHTDLSTLQSTALDFTYDHSNGAGDDICVGLFYHNAWTLGQDVSQDKSHNFWFENRNGSTDLQQPVYMIQTHSAFNGTDVDNNPFGPGWVSFKNVSSSYTYYYYKHITFNANGGSGSMALQTIENIGYLNRNTLTRDGYLFTGWNTNPDGSGFAYANEATLKATENDKGPVTLYAQWTPITYTSAVQSGTEDAAHWSMTSNPSLAGATVDVTYSGEKRVASVATKPVTTTWTMEYTGAIQTFTAPVAGEYELQVWGAQGGQYYATGGLGGHATCRTSLTQGETIYVYVGGRGGDGISQSGGFGGWNGGGHAGRAVDGFKGSAGGGGATHISKVNNQVIGSGSGQCASLVGTNFIIVAGGGGGGAHGYTLAGAGGGESGGLGKRHDGSTGDHAVHADYTDHFYFSQDRSYGANGGNGVGHSWACEGAGGGGGGYYGGTASAANSTFTEACQDAGGCGGNSAYNSSLAWNFSTESGQREGHGRAQIRLISISGESPVAATKVADNHWQYAIPNYNVEVVVEYHPWEGTGTEADPYQISSTADWNRLADLVNGGKSYAGVYFRQTADISVNTMVGNYTDAVDTRRPFSGTYDGDGHTLTVTYNTTTQRTAPFSYVDGVSIRNLRIAGTITTTQKYAAGFIGKSDGDVTFFNCRSSVEIHSSVSGDGTHGGFAGSLDLNNSKNNTATFEGCVFDGKLLGSSTNNCGGFIGWCNLTAGVYLVHSLYAPQEVTIGTSGCKTFMRTSKSTFTTNTGYYISTLGEAQGKQARSITGASGVTVTPANTETYYNVSGIRSYGTGISYSGVLYGSNGDAISLNLTHADAPVGYSFSGYNADYGTLTGSDNPYTLTMANANAVIAAEWEVNPSVSLSDNDATMPSILSALNDGNARNITINRPLLRNGDYNTLCVPFNLSAEQLADPACPLYNCSISELTDMWVAGNELRLLMSPVSSIEAGKPYLVRYKGEASKLTEMVFSGVTVSASAGSTTNANGATMYGVLEPTNLEVNNQNYLFLVAGNQLNWPNADSPIKSFRAYFVIDGSNSGSAPVRRGMPARIVEHYDTATDAEAVSGQQSVVSCQKIIRDGQLIIIRNGVEYNAQGQLVK